jgi:hypothetical protein
VTEKQLHALVSTWQQRLGLDQWRIAVRFRDDHIDDDCAMRIHRHQRYDDAVLEVQPWVVGDGEPPDVLEREFVGDDLVERKVVHELLHLHSRDMANIIEDDLDGYLHRDAKDLLDKSFLRAEERFVDGLAAALIRAWPV